MATGPAEITIRRMPLAALDPSPYNPRRDLKPGDREYQAIARSIDRWGYVDPLVWNERTGRIVGGHQRLKILVARGAEEADVSVVDLDEIEEKALNVALNRLGSEGRAWDEEKLADLLSELRSQGYDTSLTGFSDAELERVLKGAAMSRAGADDVPTVDPENVTAKQGDLWLLPSAKLPGKYHRLVCGSSTDVDAVRRLMGGQRAALFATDPPYGVDYTGADHPSGAVNWDKIYREAEHSADVAAVEAVPLWRDAFRLARDEAITPEAMWYCWYASKRYASLEAVWAELGILLHQQIVWVKPIPVLGYSFYGWQHEPCIFGWLKGKRPKQPPVQVATVWRAGYATSDALTDVWEVDWDGKPRAPREIKHPTSKPAELFARPMRLHTKRGDICYEPFSGSGSQLIAGEQEGRLVYGMELEPFFIQVILDRYKAFTGLDPILEGAPKPKGRRARSIAAPKE